MKMYTIKSCELCPYSDIIHDCDLYQCLMMEKTIEDEELILEDCPLDDVPGLQKPRFTK